MAVPEPEMSEEELRAALGRLDPGAVAAAVERAPGLDTVTARLADARNAVREWTASKPRTAKRAAAAARAIEAYVEVDAMITNGMYLPASWAARAAALPDVAEVADALVIAGLRGPVDRMNVKDLAALIVREMKTRRSPRSGSYED